VWPPSTVRICPVIHADGRRLAVRSADRVGDALRALVVEIRHDDGSARPGDGVGIALADAPGAPGHDHGPAVQYAALAAHPVPPAGGCRILFLNQA
jgi:hypothetical protein